jgi:putative membrane protein
VGRWLLVRWFVLTVAIALTAAVFPGVTIDGGLAAALGIAAVFAVADALLGAVLRLLALPFLALAFGLLALVVNASLLLLTAAVLDSFDVDGFVTAMAAGIVVTATAGGVELVASEVRAARAD